MLYRYTGLERMLQRSELLFDYFMAATAAQSSDFIPYSDFDAPLNASNPRDTSAAAIVASAALDLYNMTDDEKYLNAARNILLSLGSPTYLAQGTNYQPILLRASSKWGDPEVGAIFADFYYVEAMMRYRALFPPESPTPSDATLTNISTRGLVGDQENVMIAGFVVDGSNPISVMLRGIGPGLASFDVENTVADPVIRLFDASVSGVNPIEENDDWGDNGNLAEIEAARMATGAFELDAGSKDAVLLVTLDPGLYTVKLSGKEAGAIKTGLIEVYRVP